MDDRRKKGEFVGALGAPVSYTHLERKNRTLIPVWILVLLIALKIPIGLFILVWGLV